MMFIFDYIVLFCLKAGLLYPQQRNYYLYEMASGLVINRYAKGYYCSVTFSQIGNINIVCMFLKIEKN